MKTAISFIGHSRDLRSGKTGSLGLVRVYIDDVTFTGPTPETRQRTKLYLDCEEREDIL